MAIWRMCAPFRVIHSHIERSGGGAPDGEGVLSESHAGVSGRWAGPIELKWKITPAQAIAAINGSHRPTRSTVLIERRYHASVFMLAGRLAFGLAPIIPCIAWLDSFDPPS